MRLDNEFDIGLPPERAYALLLDLEQVTPCMPGAELGERRDDGSYALLVKVKLGPMRFQYSGSVEIAERDEAARRAVLMGSARETRGQGAADARIMMTVVADGDAGSKVTTEADVNLTGRAAQMGHGVVESVAGALMGDMTRALQERFASPAVEHPEAPRRPGVTAVEPVLPAPPSATPVRVGAVVWAVVRDAVKRLARRAAGRLRSPRNRG